MQIRHFVVQLGDESALRELNKFLRGQRILQVSEVFSAGAWVYSVRYLTAEDTLVKGKAERKDYRKILDEKTFHYYSELRERRKRIAAAHDVPAYVVFTNEELAAISKLGRKAGEKELRSVSGVGAGKAAKYGADILKPIDDAPGG